MANQLEVTNSIIISATPAAVWDALVNPEKTKVYMFGCETISDWQPGSALLWKMMHEGKELVPVKGTIVSIDAPNRLHYTVIDPFAAYPDIPENHLQVVYELAETGAHTTLLTVKQFGFEGAAEGEKRYKDVSNNGEGWNPILVQIKKLVEENGAA